MCRELGCPHPEERACGSAAASLVARSRVSKDGAAVHPSCFETAASPPPQHEGRSRSREWDVVQSKGCGFFLFSSCSGLLSTAGHHDPSARISRFHPAAYGRRAPPGCGRPPVFPLLFTGNGASAASGLARCRRRHGSLPDAVSAGARLRDELRMALLPLFRSREREAELEHRVYALQAALAQCKGVARTWWSMRVRFTVAVALVAMSAGFALGVYRHSIKQAFVN